MRVTRGDSTWILYPTTSQEEQIFAAIAQLIVPGEKFHRNEWSRPDGGPVTALISAGGVLALYHQQLYPNCRSSAWIDGINIPFVVPDDPEFLKLRSTMGICGLVYVGPSNGGLEVYGTDCKYCHARMLDSHQCLTEVCATCAAECEHEVWEPDHLVGTADGGIAMGEQCVHCKLTRGPATDDRAGVERATGILVVTRNDDVREVVDTLLLPDPDLSELE